MESRERNDAPVGPTFRSGVSDAAQSSNKGPARIPGLEYERFFTKEGVDPFDEVEWDLRSAIISSEKGEVVLEQRDVEIPRFWSQQATNIVVSKYFRGRWVRPSASAASSS